MTARKNAAIMTNALSSLEAEPPYGEVKRMARKRMLSPEFWTDEKLGDCTRDERLLFMGLISQADDEGRGQGNPKLVKALVFPYDDDITTNMTASMLKRLAAMKLIALYDDGCDHQYYWLPRFLKHQVINKPIPSKLPSPPTNIAKK